MVRECRASRNALHCCCSAERTPGPTLAPASSAVPQNASASSIRSCSSLNRSFVCAAALSKPHCWGLDRLECEVGDQLRG
jgi:hypothetical protein